MHNERDRRRRASSPAYQGRAPENVRGGMRAVQLSTVHVLAIALFVCGAIPAIAFYFAVP